VDWIRTSFNALRASWQCAFVEGAKSASQRGPASIDYEQAEYCRRWTDLARIDSLYQQNAQQSLAFFSIPWGFPREMPILRRCHRLRTHNSLHVRGQVVQSHSINRSDRPDCEKYCIYRWQGGYSSSKIRSAWEAWQRTERMSRTRSRFSFFSLTAPPLSNTARAVTTALLPSPTIPSTSLVINSDGSWSVVQLWVQRFCARKRRRRLHDRWVRHTDFGDAEVPCGVRRQTQTSGGRSRKSARLPIVCPVVRQNA